MSLQDGSCFDGYSLLWREKRFKVAFLEIFWSSIGNLYVVCIFELVNSCTRIKHGLGRTRHGRVVAALSSRFVYPCYVDKMPLRVYADAAVPLRTVWKTPCVISLSFEVLLPGRCLTMVTGWK
jgi:hypothetical protein